MSDGAEFTNVSKSSERSPASAVSEVEAREGYEWVQLGPKSIEIPKQWEVRCFGDVFEKRREKITTDEDDIIRYVGLDDIESDNIHLQDYDENGADRSSTRGFREGDVLFGKLRPYLNKAAVAPFDGICSSDIIPIHTSDESTQRFLLYLMHSKVMRDRAISTTSGTNLPRTSWGDLASAQFPYPSLLEQRRIAEILLTVDEQIQQTEAVIETAEELRRGLIQSLLRKGIGNESTKEVKIGPRIHEIPKHWGLSRVAEILSDTKKPVRGGPPGGKIHKSDRIADGFKLYTQENLTKSDLDWGDDYISSEKFEELKSAEPEPGDVLITRAGTVGRTVVFPKDAERGIIDSALMRVRVDEEICSPEYLSMLVGQSWLVDAQVRSMSQSGVIRNLNNRIIKQLQIPIPPFPEQNRILDILSQTREKLEQERETKETYKELKRGLMQDLLTGTVRVPESIEAEG